jgi:hypothetical protein
MGNGDYFFPALPDGKYNLWAQTLGFETSKGEIDLTAKRQQDFKLAAITDPEQKIKQMPSEMLAAARGTHELIISPIGIALLKSQGCQTMPGTNAIS